MPLPPLISKPFGCRRVLAALLLLALAGCAAGKPAADPAASALDGIVAGEAVAAEQAGDYASAARHYASLYETNRSDPAVAEALARSLRHAGDLAGAYDVLGEAITRLGANGRLLVEKGKVEIGLGKAALAVSTLEAAGAALPKEWEPPATLAVAFDRLGRFDEAAAQYRAALARNAGDNAEIYNNFALSRALAGRLDEARALLRTAATLPSATARVRENLAFLETLQQQPPAAPVRVAVPAPAVR